MNSLANNYGLSKIDLTLNGLTSRERDVASLSILEDRFIAYEMDISYYTVLSHLKNIRNKKDVINGRHMVYFAMKTGLIN